MAASHTFQTLLELLYTSRFTGAITLHLHNGIPRIAEYGKPNRVTFATNGEIKQEKDLTSEPESPHTPDRS